MLILWGFTENTLLFFFWWWVGVGGGGRFLVKRREGGVVDTPMNTMVAILNEKLECGYTSDIFAFTAIVLNDPANACLNNNVLKFQLYQSVSQSFRLPVTLVSYFFGQSVCQMLCSKYHCLVFVGPFLYYCSFYWKN